MGDCLDQPASLPRLVWPSRSYVTSAAGELHPETTTRGRRGGDRQDREEGRVGSGAQSQIKVLRQTTTKVEKNHLYLNVMHNKTQPAYSSVLEPENHLLLGFKKGPNIT